MVPHFCAQALGPGCLLWGRWLPQGKVLGCQVDAWTGGWRGAWSERNWRPQVRKKPGPRPRDKPGPKAKAAGVGCDQTSLETTALHREPPQTLPEIPRASQKVPESYVCHCRGSVCLGVVTPTSLLCVMCHSALSKRPQAPPSFFTLALLEKRTGGRGAPCRAEACSVSYLFQL